MNLHTFGAVRLQCWYSKTLTPMGILLLANRRPSRMEPSHSECYVTCEACHIGSPTLNFQSTDKCPANECNSQEAGSTAPVSGFGRTGLKHQFNSVSDLLFDRRNAVPTGQPTLRTAGFHICSLKTRTQPLETYFLTSGDMKIVAVYELDTERVTRAKKQVPNRDVLQEVLCTASIKPRISAIVQNLSQHQLVQPVDHGLHQRLCP